MIGFSQVLRQQPDDAEVNGAVLEHWHSRIVATDCWRAGSCRGCAPRSRPMGRLVLFLQLAVVRETDERSIGAHSVRQAHHFKRPRCWCCGHSYVSSADDLAGGAAIAIAADPAGPVEESNAVSEFLEQSFDSVCRLIDQHDRPLVFCQPRCRALLV